MGYRRHGPCALYRVFAADGRLLYIGQSPRVSDRISSHACTKSWAPDIATVTLEWFPDRASAKAAEDAAIAAEQPEWNVHGKTNAKHARGIYDAAYDRDDRSTWAAPSPQAVS